MEIKLTKETLAGKSLLVGTPMYGGMCYGTFMRSCLDLQAVCAQYGVECKFSFLFNESLIQRARNYVADEFMRSNCTHMIFIDSDISFNPIDVIAMLAIDKPILGGPYPKKCINWENVKKAVLKNPNISGADLSVLGGDIVFNPVPGTTKFDVSEPVAVMELGTGFLMIKREVFEKYQQEYKHRFYKPDHVSTEFFNGSREICSFFNVEINPESKRTESEDYCFCHEVSKIGYTIWMAPWIELQHSGMAIFQGSLPRIAQFLGEM